MQLLGQFRNRKRTVDNFRLRQMALICRYTGGGPVTNETPTLLDAAHALSDDRATQNHHQTQRDLRKDIGPPMCEFSHSFRIPPRGSWGSDGFSPTGWQTFGGGNGIIILLL